MTQPTTPPFASPADLRMALQVAGYLADDDLATAAWLAQGLERPLLLEGDAGVGKTALAAALAQVHGAKLVRLQCFEGLDMAQAAYEWNYGKQLLSLRADGSSNGTNDVFNSEFLLERPLLQSIRQEGPCVLLIDEVDRADEAFEAFLLEVLAEFQITVPELGTIKAKHIPQVVLTCNGTRELSDALRRRCLYHHLDYPSLAREISIVQSAMPDVDRRLIEEATAFVQRLRGQDLAKTPGIAETLDWIKALHKLNVHLSTDDTASILTTMGCLLKTREDRFQHGADSVRALLEGKRHQGVAPGQHSVPSH
ncbi:MAG: hypothetical protein RL357_915 [Pseudomonadota bacterium]